ncbi:Uma2 family endonuclease [Labedaea rhizosphaerae]|uniref:Uma2 family endonuclease n=1 Tax=Labedaea rhizosphaerae TaxID=598644 RepID=A0A4R6SCD7_LABRH|nr:Uma2 family endonuclease [Labedaea rhizosphaerae]TDP97294.1 Uma2 family endonuclease [Labedaea rhizosphaerae]
MTAEPIDFRRQYTVAEFAALPEDNSARYELEEGHLVVSPRPSNAHTKVIFRLCEQIEAQLPADLTTMSEVDVDLQLSVPVVRIPDIVVVPAILEDAKRMVTAADVVLVIEVISPGSVRTDTKVKPLEYADAGIPSMWLIDQDRPVSATILTSIDGEYEESQRAEHRFSVLEPLPLTIDLDKLRRSPDRG